MNPNKALWEKGDFTRIAESMRESGEALVKGLGITKGLKVLDLGCGDGTTALPAARLGADVLGVDIASNLVEAGNQRARELGLAMHRDREPTREAEDRLVVLGQADDQLVVGAQVGRGLGHLRKSSLGSDDTPLDFLRHKHTGGRVDQLGQIWHRHVRTSFLDMRAAGYDPPMDSWEISFGRFRLDLPRRELRRDGQPVRLHPRALGILCALAEAKGEIAYAASFIEWFAEEAKRALAAIPAVERNANPAVDRAPSEAAGMSGAFIPRWYGLRAGPVPGPPRGRSGRAPTAPS